MGAELVSRGHRVVWFLDGHRHDLVDPDANPSIVTWPSYRPTHLRDALFLFSQMRRHRPSCVVAVFGSVNLMMLVGWLMRVPVRVAWYQTLARQLELDSSEKAIRRQLLRLRKRLVFKFATNLVAVSQAAKRDLELIYKIESRRIVVHNNLLGDPKTPVSQLSRRKQKNEIVCVARFDRSKGQDVLVRAISELASDLPELEISFFGTGPTREACEQLAHKLDVDHMCRFRGSVPHEEILAALAGAELSVLPSRSDAFGLAIIESLAVGTPVAASSVGGIPDLVRDGVDGLLVPPDDPKALARALKALLQDDESRSRMMKNARDRYLSLFNLSTRIRDQADWLERLHDPVDGGHHTN